MSNLLVRLSAAAAIMLGTSLAFALPDTGSPAPNARVVDADDRPFDLSSVRGRPLLIVYEDKGSATLNRDFKRALSRLGRTEKYRAGVSFVPVADVRAYDYWPVRGFVKDAIRSESKKEGTTIYCDWKGDFGKTFRLQHGTSSVVLVGKDGRVLFGHEGQLSAADTERVIGLIQAQVDAS